MEKKNEQHRNFFRFSGQYFEPEFVYIKEGVCERDMRIPLTRYRRKYVDGKPERIGPETE